MPRNTNDMSKEEVARLKKRLEASLAQAITDVSALYPDIYEISPSIRLTNNKTRLGSTKPINGAVATKRKYSKSGNEQWSKPPVFQISISARECSRKSDVNNVLYHEVIHCIPGCFNHGPKFKEAATRVNAAYGTNVETTKKEGVVSRRRRAQSGVTVSDETQLREKLSKRIGKTFKHKTKTFTFIGFNGRPKNCCSLVDSKGNEYVCNVVACAHMMGIR